MAKEKLFKAEDFDKPVDEQPAPVPPVAETPQPKQTPSGGGKGKVIGIVVAVVVVVALIVCAVLFMHKGDEATAPAAAPADTAAKAQPADSAKTPAPAPANDEASSEAPASDTQPEAAPSDGSLLDKARQVIRGDYGNGKVRRDRLGDQYQPIQDKVNELYRQGLAR